MPPLKTIIPCILLCLLLSMAACTKNNAVKLTYMLGPAATKCVGEVVVFKFEDKRSGNRLGKDDDGMFIDTLSDVADWVGWALFDELKAAGCDPKYRTSTITDDALPVVTGEVLDVSLNQTGTTTYVGKVAIRVVIEQNGEVVHSEKFSSEVQDVVMPGYASRSDLMAETLRALMAEVLPSVERNI